MLLSHIEYEEGRYTKKRIWCPRYKTSGFKEEANARGAWANLSSLANNPEHYVNPEECSDCEFKMYRMIGTTCPEEVPDHRRQQW